MPGSGFHLDRVTGTEVGEVEQGSFPGDGGVDVAVDDGGSSRGAGGDAVLPPTHGGDVLGYLQNSADALDWADFRGDSQAG